MPDPNASLALTFLAMTCGGAVGGLLMHVVAVLTGAERGRAFGYVVAAGVGVLGAVVVFSALAMLDDAGEWPVGGLLTWPNGGIAGCLAVFYRLALRTLPPVRLAAGTLFGLLIVAAAIAAVSCERAI